MKIKWVDSAIDNLAGIADYIAENNPEKARNIVRKIRSAISNLSKQPAMGRLGRVQGTKELVIVGTPYLIVYRIQQQNIEILRVLHGAQKWPPTN
ncbi:MAG: RelE/StbE family addiction module toxin [bacterium]|nr:MAG: RelE/StbE family addiction module toxin [bacterium]